MRLFTAALFALALSAAIPAHADERAEIGLPPAGHTLVNLSATENKVLKQDLLVATLRYEISNKDNKVVQKQINETMAKAVAIAKKYDTLKSETGSYSLYQNHEPIVDEKSGEVKGHKQEWRGSQEITIKSVDSETVLKATGEMQDLGLVMNNLQYTLSPEVAEKEKDALLVAALKKLDAKAGVIAKALGKSGHELADVTVDSAPQPPIMYAKAMRMEMAADAGGMAPPVAMAGESTVSLTVNARVLLKP